MVNKKLIGITGGIGAGKTLVCSIIHATGYPVFYSDKAAKNILNSDDNIKGQINAAFGKEAYLNNELNRSYISQKIFNDKKLLTAINEIVHPAVRQAFAQWAEEQTTDLVFNEAAILFETGAYKLYDANVLVVAPESIRIERVMQRDQISEQAVRARINKQWSDAEKISLADHIITNDNIAMLIPQVLDLITKLRS
ncbi:MAG: dephospho-CoA kinase [Crocinitomix sp.]|nr:dephospho-CoA kinase [Crocinitomix sp.]